MIDVAVRESLWGLHAWFERKKIVVHTSSVARARGIRAAEQR
ncbi:hypothetical protein DAD186_10610 [Dermabacter vaginalis]|uniref:Uncharacterized protein n=1 Tax=Dermabacter vaginalis TaxID=1630135 RepID=A0A1B0ZI50_9MICO|nr:hypothetical protein DAD186_10610 [Dermabacter vaginalis]